VSRLLSNQQNRCAARECSSIRPRNYPTAGRVPNGRYIGDYNMKFLYVCTIILGLLLAVGISAFAADQHYYVMQQGKVSEITRTAADRLDPDYWEVWFFRRGTNPGPNRSYLRGFWGSESDKGLDEVLEATKKHIDFQHENERWCGCDGGSLTMTLLRSRYGRIRTR
jgi:hypothetical protein